MNAPTLPPGVTIVAPPPALKLGDNEALSRWRMPGASAEDANGDARSPDGVDSATTFPERVETGEPSALRGKLFACSGGIESMQYQEATRFRPMSDLTWLEARVALNRLLFPVTSYYWRDRTTTPDYIALAEFALTAHGFTGFAGLRGRHAIKLRDELQYAIRTGLYERLHCVLHAAVDVDLITRPITNRLKGDGWRGNGALWAMVPIAADRWVRVNEATPDQAITALDFLRAMLATWNVRRPTADGIAARMLRPDDMPTAAEYAEALHIAEMLALCGAKLATLYAGVMHSMPIYRLYPATSEPDAIALWWPWGRSPPLIDGGPARPPRSRKKVLDPAIVTTKRPQDVVREVMKRTSINRTTAQRMTATLRADMRRKRNALAETMLRGGETKATVARTVGLSPSRISAMFKGRVFTTSLKLVPPAHLHRDDGPLSE
jgi:hypothetical protein